MKMICPRCGWPYTDYATLSRYCDAKICSACGRDEAIRGFLGIPQMPFDDWYSDPRAK